MQVFTAPNRKTSTMAIDIHKSGCQVVSLSRLGSYLTPYTPSKRHPNLVPEVEFLGLILARYTESE